jgi:hypothetical protein
MTLFNIYVTELRRTPTSTMSLQTLQGIFPDRDPAEAAKALAEASGTTFEVTHDGFYKFERTKES